MSAFASAILRHWRLPRHFSAISARRLRHVFATDYAAAMPAYFAAAFRLQRHAIRHADYADYATPILLSCLTLSFSFISLFAADAAFGFRHTISLSAFLLLIAAIFDRRH
jgi:hypothetical protein